MPHLAHEADRCSARALVAVGASAIALAVSSVSLGDPVAADGTPSRAALPEPTCLAPTRPDRILSIATYNLLQRSASDPAQVGVRACSIACGIGAPDTLGVQEVASQHVASTFGHFASFAGGRGTPWVPGLDYAAEVDDALTSPMKVGYLYRRSSVTLLSEPVSHQKCVTEPLDGLERACVEGNAAGHLLYDRPPYIARFEAKATGGRVNVIVNHWLSPLGRDPTATLKIHLAMAHHNLELVNELRTAECEVPVILMGDLNAVRTSPAITVLRSAGSLIEKEVDYTYVLSGTPEAIDYVFVTPELATADVQAVHINVDFPEVPHDELRGTCPLGAPHERASDHDPVLLRVPLELLPSPPAYLPMRVFLPRVDGGTRADTCDMRRRPVRIDAVFEDGVQRDEGDEWVAFTNFGMRSLDLTGWTLTSVRGMQRYAFPSGARIAAHETCRVYTNDPDTEWCDFRYASPGAIWNNSDGDQAELRDERGCLVDCYAYGKWRDRCASASEVP